MKKICALLTASMLSTTAYAAKIKVDEDEYKTLQYRTQKIEKELKKLQKQVKTYSPKALKHTINFSLPKMRIFGAYDKTLVNNDGQNRPNTSELRYARVRFSHKLEQQNAPDLRLRLEVDFGNRDTKVTDAFADIAFNKSNYLRIGQAKEPMSLAELGSSTERSLLETPAGAVFAPGRNAGIQYVFNNMDYQFATGLFGDNVNDSANSSDETVSYTTRAVWVPKLPVLSDAVTTHLGASWRTSYPTGDTASYSVKEARYSSATGTADLATGTISNVRKVNTSAVELAFVNPRVAVSGEYFINDVKRKNNNEPLQFEGGYVQTSLALNKPIIDYSRSKKVLTVNGEEAKNAFELVHRYSYVDLNHLDIRGGGYTSNTVGVNYYFNPNLRFMLNYVNAKTDSNAATANNSPEIVALRTQFLF